MLRFTLLLLRNRDIYLVTFSHFSAPTLITNSKLISDRYFLEQELQKLVFTQIIQRTAHESYIFKWTAFNLNTEPDHSIYKPDSIYIEAIK